MVCGEGLWSSDDPPPHPKDWWPIKDQLGPGRIERQRHVGSPSTLCPSRRTKATLSNGMRNPKLSLKREGMKIMPAP